MPTGRGRLPGKARWAPASVQGPSDKLGGEVICPPGAQEPREPHTAAAKDPREQIRPGRQYNAVPTETPTDLRKVFAEPARKRKPVRTAQENGYKEQEQIRSASFRNGVRRAGNETARWCGVGTHCHPGEWQSLRSL